MNLDLTQEDVAILADVVRSYQNELYDEIAHTENFEFREALLERQRRLTAILGRLSGQQS